MGSFLCLRAVPERKCSGRADIGLLERFSVLCRRHVGYVGKAFCEIALGAKVQALAYLVEKELAFYQQLLGPADALVCNVGADAHADFPLKQSARVTAAQSGRVCDLLQRELLGQPVGAITSL